MSRGTRNPSEIFRSVLSGANADLVLAAKRAGQAFEHRGVKGDERAAALHQFFIDRLPAGFGVAKGEAVDYKDRKSGQLDLIIYEKAGAAPIEKGKENLLLPCESLYAVIEVKSILSEDECRKAFVSAKKIRDLRPFKKPFIAARKDGAPAEPESCRCLYVLFAFETNLSATDWIKKEYERSKKVANQERVPLNVIDRIVVLDRGMITPDSAVGKSSEAEEDEIFIEFFFHIVNFLRRESGRRPPMDWQIYTERYSAGWRKIQ